jgi:hypothetical protein
MDYQMTRQEAIRNLLQSQEFLDVIEELRDNQLNNIRYSEANQIEERERYYNRLQAIDEIMAYLESITKDGDIKDKAWKIL